MLEFIEDTDNQRCICKSDKLVTEVVIEKSKDGFIFFEINFSKGTKPEELSGKYSSMREAKKAVTKYLANKKESKAARRENFAKELKERKVKNGSKTEAKGSTDLHKGPDH
jgi:hypothetical protein